VGVRFEQAEKDEGKESREGRREGVEASTTITRTNQNTLYKQTSKRPETHLNPFGQRFDGKNTRDGLSV
jgi:hypothetical protein